MKPHRVIKRRKQSKPAQHGDGCVGRRRMSIEPNALRAPAGASLVVDRCDGCGKIVEVRGVLPAPELVNNDDQDDCA